MIRKDLARYVTDEMAQLAGLDLNDPDIIPEDAKGKSYLVYEAHNFAVVRFTRIGRDNKPRSEWYSGRFSTDQNLVDEVVITKNRTHSSDLAESIQKLSESV